MVKLVLSEDEKQHLVKELAERIKDLIFMKAHEQAEQAIGIVLKRVNGEDMNPNETFTIEFRYEFAINDLVQIVGRYRRMKQGRASGFTASSCWP
jgi:hypothetical protein